MQAQVGELKVIVVNGKHRNPNGQDAWTAEAYVHFGDDLDHIDEFIPREPFLTREEAEHHALAAGILLAKRLLLDQQTQRMTGVTQPS